MADLHVDHNTKTYIVTTPGRQEYFNSRAELYARYPEFIPAPLTAREEKAAQRREATERGRHGGHGLGNRWGGKS